MAARSKFDLQKFRHAVSILKKKGLIKNVDARTAQPFFIRQGKTLKETVKKFDDVVSGKVEPVSLPPEKVKKYKQAGYETYTPHKGDINKVLVPKSATETVSVTKDKEIQIKEKTGITRIKKAVPFKSLTQWLQDMQKDRLRINAMKRRNEWFGYKIAGNTSWTLYRTIEQMIEDLVNGTMSSHGTPIAERYPTRKSGEEFFEALEIVRVPRPEAWPNPPAMRRIPFTKRGPKKVKGPLAIERERAKKADAMRKWRAGLKGKKLKEYKKDAAKRAKRWRKKNR